MSAFPPIRTQKGLNVTPDTALLYLSAYLTSSKTSPHLLPNARLEASGPTAGSSNASVTIHNLQRVEAGLRGEWLAPELELEEEEQVKQVRKLKGGEETEEGWMDLDQYQREQSVEGPEFAQDELGVEDDGDVEGNTQVDFYGSGAEEDGDVVMGEAKAVAPPIVKKVKKVKELDPEARKKAKKDRMKEEKRAKEEQRKQRSQKDA